MSKQLDKLRIYVFGRGWLNALRRDDKTGKINPRFTSSKRLAREYDSIMGARQMARRMEDFAVVPMGETRVAEIWHDDVVADVIHLRKSRMELSPRTMAAKRRAAKETAALLARSAARRRRMD